MTDVVQVDELPIGTGQRRVAKASESGGVDTPNDRDGARGSGDATTSPAPTPPLSLVPLETQPPPPVELPKWEPAKMRKPLQIAVGKSVNWRMRKVTGVETTAGLMTNDQADAINEPLADILNRFEPTRAIAAHQTELALGIAIWDYVQATVHQAGRDVLALEEGARVVARSVNDGNEPIFAPAPPPAEPAKPTNVTEDEL